MDTWTSFVNWLGSEDARPALLGAAVTGIAILVSVVIAALISRGAISSLLRQRDREAKVAAIAALVDSSTEAAVWASLTPQEQVLADRAVGQADILVRLLPIRGSALAANWSAHQLAELKRNSATFGFQLDPVVAEFRDRLIEWQNKPRKAKKIFAEDLGRWRNESVETVRAASTDRWVDAPTQAAPAPALPREAPVYADAAPTVIAEPTTPVLIEDQTVPTATASPLAGADETTLKLLSDVAAIDASGRTAAERDTPHPL